MPRGGQRSAAQKLEAAGKGPAPRHPRLASEPWGLPGDTRSRGPGPPGFTPSLQQPQETDAQTGLSPPGLRRVSSARAHVLVQASATVQLAAMTHVAVRPTPSQRGHPCRLGPASRALVHVCGRCSHKAEPGFESSVTAGLAPSSLTRGRPWENVWNKQIRPRPLRLEQSLAPADVWGPSPPSCSTCVWCESPRISHMSLVSVTCHTSRTLLSTPRPQAETCFFLPVLRPEPSCSGKPTLITSQVTQYCNCQASRPAHLAPPGLAQASGRETNGSDRV